MCKSDFKSKGWMIRVDMWLVLSALYSRPGIQEYGLDEWMDKSLRMRRVVTWEKVFFEN